MFQKSQKTVSCFDVIMCYFLNNTRGVDLCPQNPTGHKYVSPNSVPVSLPKTFVCVQQVAQQVWQILETQIHIVNNN